MYEHESFAQVTRQRIFKKNCGKSQRKNLKDGQNKYN